VFALVVVSTEKLTEFVVFFSNKKVFARADRFLGRRYYWQAGCRQVDDYVVAERKQVYGRKPSHDISTVGKGHARTRTTQDEWHTSVYNNRTHNFT
jgi:hypothetical protein